MKRMEEGKTLREILEKKWDIPPAQPTKPVDNDELHRVRKITDKYFKLLAGNRSRLQVYYRIDKYTLLALYRDTVSAFLTAFNFVFSPCSEDQDSWYDTALMKMICFFFST